MLNNTKTQSRPKLLFLVPAISQTHKSFENSQDFFVETKTKTKTKTLGLKTLFFVLEAPRDQDFGLEDYNTGWQSWFDWSFARHIALVANTTTSIIVSSNNIQNQDILVHYIILHTNL